MFCSHDVCVYEWEDIDSLPMRRIRVYRHENHPDLFSLVITEITEGTELTLPTFGFSFEKLNQQLSSRGAPELIEIHNTYPLSLSQAFYQRQIHLLNRQLFCGILPMKDSTFFAVGLRTGEDSAELVVLKLSHLGGYVEAVHTAHFLSLQELAKTIQDHLFFNEGFDAIVYGEGNYD